jgi:ribonucleoside-diphosphate reductase alpha chain
MNSTIPFQPTSHEIWTNKYQLKDREGNPIDKNIEDTYKRVAAALADVETENRSKHYESFLWALNNGAIPAGRIISNAYAQAYKPKTSTINCVVSDVVEDSMDSILHGVHRAGLTLKAGCGIGYDFSHLRPKGSFVNGAGATTSGPLSFMDIYDKMCFTVSSAGGRRGAQMATFHVRHPDVEDFIKAKREDGRLRQFNLSLLIDDSFIEAVMKDEDWDLAFPLKKDEPFSEKDKLIYIKWPKSTEDQFTLDSDENTLCKVYKTVKAKYLWDIIMESTYNFAEPGFILVDEINRRNNNWFCEDISSTNPCVTGDSQILTDKGLQSVEKLVGKSFNAIVDGKSYPCVSNGFFSTGVKDIFKLTTKSGFNLRCTEDHKIMTSEGWVKAKDLWEESLISLNCGTNIDDLEVVNSSEEFKRGYALGLLIGNSIFSEGSAIISIWGNKTEKGNDYSDMQKAIDLVEEYLLSLSSRNDFNGFQEITDRCEKRIKCQAFTDIAAQYGLAQGNKIITNRILETTDSEARGILRGLFDADGTVNTHEKSRSVRLCQSDLDILENVQLMLSRFGIISKIYKRDKENFELVITKNNIIRYAHLIGFESVTKQSKLSQLLGTAPDTFHTEKFTDRFKSMTPCGQEEVYDCTIDTVHRYSCNGILISNCGEQPLPPNGSCLLGSINLTKFVINPFTKDAHFDWENFKKCVRIFTRMLDNVVEISGLPLPEQVKEITDKRRHGMGFLGLGSALTMLTVKYGSDASLEFTELVAKTMALEGFKVGVELAKEKGPAPIFNRTTVCEKKPVSNRYLFCKSRYRLIESSADLRQDIIEHGCRFTHHTSIAPTGTISLSLANNASNGIEPTFSHEYSRNVIKEGRATKEKVNVTSFELLAYRELINPDAKVNELPDYFVTTDDISPMAHIKVQAAAQRWIDSSISKTVNVPSDFPFEDFKDIYLEAYKHGLKGCTTFRFNPEAFQGVLVKEDDLANTTYDFTLEDGTVISAKGNDSIMYDGQEHTAANLYDAIKEGYYGKL